MEALAQASLKRSASEKKTKGGKDGRLAKRAKKTLPIIRYRPLEDHPLRDKNPKYDSCYAKMDALANLDHCVSIDNNRETDCECLHFLRDRKPLKDHLANYMIYYHEQDLAKRIEIGMKWVETARKGVAQKSRARLYGRLPVLDQSYEVYDKLVCQNIFRGMLNLGAKAWATIKKSAELGKLPDKKGKRDYYYFSSSDESDNQIDLFMLSFSQRKAMFRKRSGK